MEVSGRTRVMEVASKEGWRRRRGVRVAAAGGGEVVAREGAAVARRRWQSGDGGEGRRWRRWHVVHKVGLHLDPVNNGRQSQYDGRQRVNAGESRWPQFRRTPS